MTTTSRTFRVLLATAATVAGLALPVGAQAASSHHAMRHHHAMKHHHHAMKHHAMKH
jgi:hypothetical protein